MIEKDTQMRRKIALLTYSVIGLVDLVLGYVYLTANTFLAYHSQAIGASWEDVDSGIQAVILALMKVTGAGWCALGFFTIAIVLAELKQCGTLARWALPAGTLLFYGPTLFATWTLYRETGAQASWASSLAAIISKLVAMVIYVPWPIRNRTSTL